MQVTLSQLQKKSDSGGFYDTIVMADFWGFYTHKPPLQTPCGPVPQVI